MTNAPVTLSSRAFYGSRKGQSPEDPWHAVWPRTIFKIFLTHTGAYNVYSRYQGEQLSDTGFLPLWPVDSRPSAKSVQGFLRISISLVVSYAAKVPINPKLPLRPPVCVTTKPYRGGGSLFVSFILIYHICHGMELPL